MSAARRLACDGVVLPIFTRNGAPIDVGRTYRIVSNPLRALIEGRDRHCQWSGCTIPGRWCVVHHVKHWKDGGSTDRWNLLLLCEHHHQAAHDGRFTVIPARARSHHRPTPRRQAGPVLRDPAQCSTADVDSHRQAADRGRLRMPRRRNLTAGPDGRPCAGPQ